MVESLVNLLGLIATVLIFRGRKRIRQPIVRVAVLVVAVVLAYPAANACYIAMKDFADGFRDGAQGG